MKIRTALVVVAAACATALTGCGDEEAAPTGAEVALTATDTTCEVAATSFAPGPVTFAVTNRGQQTTEVYLYGREDDGFTKVVAEVENVGPGLTRNLRATLSGGEYEIACKPGQKGDGIRTRITVSDGATDAPAAEPAYDREVEIEVAASGITGLDGLIAEPGDKIEFKLTNKTPTARTLTVADPSGKTVAEVTADPNGGAEKIVSLGGEGDWKLTVEGQGATPVTSRLVVR
ncbi:cupredoxin domain-containing protein [Micromonospora narathiwatensis]|uniref:Cupredoxin-like domain-containing protein n=1 Tax=Micromonospora narathiwatensis TaxID=299146 RepID=A0A1A8ZDN5_9ACTN|nr:cupredoxin domain-containing protein [Micromonospora narathiwatensis]SBT41971.1 Cupredoxin-like domain-containing protein [Micromonospora narathiwatensis]